MNQTKEKAPATSANVTSAKTKDRFENTTTANRSKDLFLMPCPFCGKTPVIKVTPRLGLLGAAVECSCGCRGAIVQEGINPATREKRPIGRAAELAAQRWNSRTEVTQ